MLDDTKKQWFCAQASAMKQRMYALAFGILKNEADAEDAIQNALLCAYEHLDELRMTDRFRPWMLRILTRECFRISCSRAGYTDIDEANIPASVPDADMQLSIWEAVNALDLRSREAILLYYYEQLSTREMAQVLGISEENARQRLTRARVQLRKTLNREDFL